MNDQPTYDALSRASAYLDGELAADEIAEAEADPAVMAEVAHLRSLQESIRDVAEPTSSAREKAIATALAEFDRRRHPAPVVGSRPRPAYSRWLAVAAAVAGLAALGAVITSARGDDGDGDDAATEMTSAAGAPAATLSASGADAGGAPTPPPPASGQSEAVLAAETNDAPDATQYTAEDAVAEESASRAAPATTTAAAAAFDPATPIADEVELGRVGRQLLAEFTAGALAPRSATPCDQTIPDVVVLSDALLMVGGEARPVLVAGNPDTQETFAFDPETCLVLATGR
jgi:hypothetical protein